MSNQFNYLDKEGVRQLWAAVKTHDENVLTSVEDKIKDISLTYDQDAKKIFLTGTGAESPVSIDVNDFVKDGVLDTVNVVEATPESPIESLTD